ncbi:MAG: UvrD-helicase domain-containing protein [Acidimicrobiia bacterium]
MSAHPDLEAEQAHLDRAADALTAMRAMTARLVDLAAADRKRDNQAAAQVEDVLRRRAGHLETGSLALCFGRLDHEDGERFYVGRRHVEDEHGDPLVIDWRARAAVPFYRATVRDAQGLTRRRRFFVDGPKLVDILDEVFDDPDSVLAGLVGGIPDPLLAELERSRTGEMHDIVATIQGEQDAVVRSPLEQCLVVQGGPGTGKTAVGLHRAAYLLYEHRDTIGDQGVLIIGPNRAFLRYIEQVLPSLGETGVLQTTVDQLRSNTFPARGTDTVEAATLKGDVRMATVIANAVGALVKPAVEVTVWTKFGRFVVPADEIDTLMIEARIEAGSYGAARDDFRTKVARAVWHRANASRPELQLTASDCATQLRADKKAMAVLDKLMPATSPAALVRSLLTGKATLARAAKGVLSPDEQRLLLRAKGGASVNDERWTAADIALLDEAEARITGNARRFGHVVIDEAQDHSAMGLRMLGRRVGRTRSMTVLGDLAQATTPWAQNSWTDALGHLDAGDAGRVEHLEVGYRVPGPILELANRLLPEAAPDVPASRSVRAHGEAPSIVAVADHDRVLDEVAAVVDALANRWMSVVVIGPEAMLGELQALVDRQAAITVDTVLAAHTPLSAKGLEFDAVVVVEPGVIHRSVNGARQLYVAMTRPVQHLSLVHHEPLPPVL